MNHSKQIVAAALALGMAAVPLSLVFAETDTTTSAGASAEATVSADASTGAVVSPRDAASGLPTGKMAPRDAATGQSTGKRQHAPVMMGASTTADTDIEAREQMKLRMQDRVGMNASTSQDRREAAEERRMNTRNDARRALGERTILRLGAALDRMAKLADRIESRATKMTEKGVDVSATTALLVTARAKISDGRTALDEASVALDAYISADVSDNMPCVGGATGTACGGAMKSQGNQALRTLLEKAHAAVRAAHKALVDAVVSLKASVKSDTTVVVGTSTTGAASSSASGQ